MMLGRPFCASLPQYIPAAWSNVVSAPVVVLSFLGTLDSRKLPGIITLIVDTGYDTRRLFLTANRRHYSLDP